MKYDFIGLEETSVIDTSNLKLKLKGTILINKPNFKIKCDGINIEPAVKIKNNKFNIEMEFQKKTKKIEVFVEKDDKLVLVFIWKKKLIIKTIKKLKKLIFSKIITKFRRKTSNINHKLKYTINTIYKGIRLAWREHHFLIPPIMWKKYISVIKTKIKGENNSFYNPFDSNEYNLWLMENKVQEEIKEFKYNPLISIIIPVYNIERNLLKDCLNSILKQTYTNFEVCIADDCSTKLETIKTLKEYEKKDNRIKVVYREKNGHISKATNSAISIAKGEFIALMDDDDVIPENALYEVIKVLNENKDLDLIYTDEDKMEMDGTLCDPHFKPDYAPDTLLGGNYICHFGFYRKSIIDKIGGFRDEFVGAQDFDLVLRFVEETNKIYHIPKVLYHWRKVPGSTAVTIDSKNYAIENGRKAVEEALKRRNRKGNVYVPINAAHYIVNYDVINDPKISIIIPTKDNYEMLEKCINSIYQKCSYKNFEVLLINNNSKKKETFMLFEKLKKQYKNFKVLNYNKEFNYSKINNYAVKQATGDYILLLNNDTEVITNNFLEIMLGYAQQKHIGAVGIKLLYEDNTIQHGGIITGIGGVAAHAYPGIERTNFGTFGRLLIPYNYTGVTAACLMIEKKKYLEVKGLEEKLAVAYNDVDFNMKLIKKGYYNIFLSHLEMYHYESKTRGLDTTTEKYKRLLEETKFMQEKWGHELKNDKFYNINYSLGVDFKLDKRRNDEKSF